MYALTVAVGLKKLDPALLHRFVEMNLPEKAREAQEDGPELRY